MLNKDECMFRLALSAFLMTAFLAISQERGFDFHKKVKVPAQKEVDFGLVKKTQKGALTVQADGKDADEITGSVFRPDGTSWTGGNANWSKAIRFLWNQELPQIGVTSTAANVDSPGFHNPIFRGSLRKTGVGKGGGNGPESIWLVSGKMSIGKLTIVSVDFIDSVDDKGKDEDNNFNIRSIGGRLFVPKGGPEWKDGEIIGPTCYIMGRRVRAKVMVKGVGFTQGVAVKVQLYSEGDLDLMPHGDKRTEVDLVFDENGNASHVFTSRKTVAKTLDLKTYKLAWKGSSDGQKSQHLIYTLYGKPVDKYNGVAKFPNDPLDTHLFYLLGPKLGGKGKWCNGTSTLNEKGKDSVPLAVRTGIRKDADRKKGSPPDPWQCLTKGGECEAWADLMMHGLWVLGASAKTDRKSIVTDTVPRPSWLGKVGNIKLVKAFREPGIVRIWVNEGACGVVTDDKKLRYYDVQGTDAIGSGGWATPKKFPLDNLWYVPPPGKGLVIDSIVPQVYGSWAPQARKAIDVLAIKDLIQQFKFEKPVINAQNCTITYRTEGVTKADVKVGILAANPRGGWVFPPLQNKAQAIAREWDNKQVLQFRLAPGRYKAIGGISKNDKTYETWVVKEDGPEFTVK